MTKYYIHWKKKLTCIGAFIDMAQVIDEVWNQELGTKNG